MVAANLFQLEAWVVQNREHHAPQTWLLCGEEGGAGDPNARRELAMRASGPLSELENLGTHRWQLAAGINLGL